MVNIIIHIISALVWMAAGMLFMGMLWINKTKDIEAEKDNAEYRAMTHLRKLQLIENILRNDTTNKTPAVLTVEKIKEVLVNERKSNN